MMYDFDTGGVPVGLMSLMPFASFTITYTVMSCYRIKQIHGKLEIHTLLWGVVLLDLMMLLFLVWCFWIISCCYFWWHVETIMFQRDLLQRWLQKLADTL